MADFIEVDDAGNFRINLKAAKDAGKLRLVRKIGFDQKGRPYVELHDPQGALGLMMKAKGMLVQRREISGPDGGPVRVGISYEEALAALRAGDGETGIAESRHFDDAPKGVIGV